MIDTDDAAFPVINIDDESIIASSDNFSSLTLAANEFTLIPGGNPQEPDDFSLTGSIVTTINTRTGEREALRFFPGESVIDLRCHFRNGFAERTAHRDR